MGEYDRAFVASERAREIFVRLGETARLATLDNNVGNIFYRQDRFEEAITYYESAYKALLDHQQWEQAGFALLNIAMCLIDLNDFPRSLDCYQRARDLYVHHNMPLLRDQADYNIASLYYLRGEYSRAIEMLSATGRSCEVTGDAYHRALCQLDLSEIYLELNWSDEATQMAHEAFLQFNKLGMPYESAKALANEAIGYMASNKKQSKPWSALPPHGKCSRVKRISSLAAASYSTCTRHSCSSMRDAIWKLASCAPERLCGVFRPLRIDW